MHKIPEDVNSYKYFIIRATLLIMNVAILAITKNGVNIAIDLAQKFTNMTVFAPKKLDNGAPHIQWYSDSTPDILGRLFSRYPGIVCIFSLGAVVRLIAPHLKSKKVDPAILVIDDKLNYVISVLSGHIGGANQLARDMASRTGAIPVITTAADVNNTIAVDLVGRDLGWRIEDDSTVTATSAHMVNNDKIGLYQDAGERNWWPGSLPGNVHVYDNIDTLRQSNCSAFLVITDGLLPDDLMKKSVVYRPPSLVVGVGLHHDTTAHTIIRGLETSLYKYNMSMLSVAKLVSVKKPKPVKGLQEAGQILNVPVELLDRESLAKVATPNPSAVVERFEGTPSVSEAAALLVSGGDLIIKKQKFPPNLTIAVASK